MARRLMLPLAVFALLVSACSSEDSGTIDAADTTTSAPTTTAAAETTTLAPTTTTRAPTTTGSLPDDEVTGLGIEVGECFDLVDADADTVDIPEPFDCDQPHQFEAFHRFEPDPGDFPGDDAVIELAEDACLSAFEVYVGIPYRDSELFFSYLFPARKDWMEGDREILCYLHLDDYTPITGTARDSRR